MIYRNISVNV